MRGRAGKEENSWASRAATTTIVSTDNDWRSGCFSWVCVCLIMLCDFFYIYILLTGRRAYVTIMGVLFVSLSVFFIHLYSRYWRHDTLKHHVNIITSDIKILTFPLLIPSSAVINESLLIIHEASFSLITLLYVTESLISFQLYCHKYNESFKCFTSAIIPRIISKTNRYNLSIPPITSSLL